MQAGSRATENAMLFDDPSCVADVLPLRHRHTNGQCFTLNADTGVLLLLLML